MDEILTSIESLSKELHDTEQWGYLAKLEQIKNKIIEWNKSSTVNYFNRRFTYQVQLSVMHS